MDTKEYILSLMGDDSEIELKGKCHDCGEPVSIIVTRIAEKEIVSSGPFWHKEGIGNFAKCLDCFEKDDVLRNYQPCEIFSRVCGYLRPVKQWNVGKQQEFKERKNYVPPNMLGDVGR